MPEIKKKEREIGPEKEEDVVVKTGRFRIYFQNYYTVISLGNDLLTGGLYFIGSLANLLEAPDLVGQLMYIAGGFFLLMRPILKIFHNVFIYDEEQYKEEVEDILFDEDIDEEESEESDRAYNEEYYGEEETQEEKKDKIKEERES